ncbi:MAG: hypothetical protein PHT07_15110 [Paludibacter sp.]|nr:hypothetical protein [Paludibacter sp.]
MKEFIHLVFGNFSLPMFVALYFFAVVGIALNLLNHANSRDQNSPNTPQKFSHWFLIKDNRRRLAMDIISLFITIRFMQFIINFDVTNPEAWLIGAFFAGFGFDKGFERLQTIKGSFLKVKRNV